MSELEKLAQDREGISLQEGVDALRRGLGEDLVAVVLFGSRARGDARAESDWDLLLLAENLPASPLGRDRFLHSLLPEKWRYRISFLAHTPSEWFQRVTSLALDIALDGVILYDTPSWSLSIRLADLRQQLKRWGLERRQIDEGEWLWLRQGAARSQWELEWTR